jgi:hypothetical protein
MTGPKVVSALLLMLAPLSSPAQAGAQCAPRDTVLGQLGQTWGETRHGMGLAANAGVMELFANPDTGSWTITVTLPDGMTCLVASGQAFEATADDASAQGDPA